MHIHLERAFEGYHGLGLDFSEFLRWHLLHGGVASCPKFLCLIRPVNSKHPESYNLEDPDSIFIEFVSSDGDSWDYLLDWMRDVYPYENIYFKRMLKGHTKIKGPFPAERVKQLLKGTK